ncbi:MAG TPA: divergent polysaccharide deacetylase family protein [Cellvibrio sp.]|nr:divergent polysaccharide deacetylase family protein [Cellvibrio sp.]
MRLWSWLIALVIGYGQSAAAIAEQRLAIIIDDIGYNKTLSERAARLPGAFTLAILPFTPNATSSAELAHRQGKELMLHAPMSNLANLPLGAGGLYSNMGQEAFMAVLRKNLDSLPLIKGVNNHMGSRLTQEALPMSWVMTELHNRGLYFVDSRTSAQTLALETAQAHSVPSAKRDVFLDDDVNTEAVSQQLDKALTIARQKGSAIAIGHPYPSTLSLLEKIQPRLLQHQVNLVFVSQLLTPTAPALAKVTPPDRASSSYCPAPPQALWYRPPVEIPLMDTAAAVITDLLGAP